MTILCWHCGKASGVAEGTRIARREACVACGWDLHCCKQCIHFDQRAYNECREPSAERVVDKDRSNFCDYFVPRLTSSGGKFDDKAAAAKAALDDLFKK